LEHRINGRSLMPLFQGGELSAVDAYAEKLNLEHRESKALRTERYKFIYSFPKPIGVEQGLTETWELYDLARDPGETVNLAGRYPERVARLDDRLRTLLELLADPGELDQPALELDPDLEDRLRALGYLGD
jgi:arylsulfatase A-like enzyme